MNFNLVSNEKDNGHEFNVRLSNPVTIPANSQIYMNFAELKRTSKIRLYDVGKVTLNIGKVFPNVYPNDRNTPNNPLVINPAASTNFTNSFDIPKGDYTFTAFRDLFNDNLNKLVNESHAAFYQARTTEQFNADADENNIAVGLCLGNDYGNSTDPTTTLTSVASEGLSVTNVFNQTQEVPDGASVRQVAYAKISGTGVTKQYNNYALSKQHYYHYAFSNEKSLPPPNQTIADPTQNLVIAYSIKPIHAMEGAITIGLYSPEYADMSGGANRIGGNLTPRNIPTTPSGTSKLACLCGIEITEADRAGANNASVMRVNWARTTIDGVQKTTKHWSNINQTISTIKSDVVGNCNDIFGASNPAIFAFQTYLDEDDELYKKEPRLYLKIYKIGNIGETGSEFFEVIYDSKLTNEYFPKSFFEADAAFYDDANKVNSQIPFSIIMAAQVENEGWEQVYYTALDKTANSSDDNKPATIIDNYGLSFNASLEKVFLQEASPTLFPNFVFRRTDLFYHRNFSLEYRTKNYSILLNNLPIGNYKNVDEKRQPSYQKAILANIPAPFGLEGNLVEPKNDTVELVAVYQPYNPIISDLRNQELVLNNFDIRIVDMNNDSTAVEIIGAVINFTIKDKM